MVAIIVILWALSITYKMVAINRLYGISVMGKARGSNAPRTMSVFTVVS